MDFTMDDPMQDYNDILIKIKQEQEKIDEVEKLLESEKNNLILIKLSLLKDIIKGKISCTEVSVFNSKQTLMEFFNDQLNIFDLYPDNKAYLLVRVTITQSVLERCVNRCYLNVQVVNDDDKFLSISSLLENNTVSTALPLDLSIKNYLVKTFICSNNENFPVIIPLDVVRVNISDYFNISPYKNDSSMKVLKLSSLYKRLKFYDPNQYTIETLIKNPGSKDTFLKLLYSNPYNMMSELDTTTSGEGSVILMNLFIEANKIRVRYNSESGVIRLKSNIQDLLILKEFFVKELGVDESYELNKLKEFVALTKEIHSSEDICDTFVKLRKII